ncbi:MAG: hypothetical protein JNL72_11115 [Flavipsychrobacter sp.]|nr:hypothetical protein [Flavipsychrobacter sp.]
MHVGIYILFVWVFFLPGSASAADSLSLIKAIPMEARSMNVDEMGNVYVVRNDNSLVKFSDGGDSLTFYRSVLNGDIGQVDVTNPLRVVVYYPAYAKVILLDRMLAPKNELDLKKLHILGNATVALSADGNLWVYDKFNVRLLKIDEQLQQMGESNDLRQQLAEVPDPAYMIERERKVYMCDSLQGIYTFDQYGSYINTLEVYGVARLQVYGTQLVYRRADTLLSYDYKKIVDNRLALPARSTGIVSAAIGRHTLYVLYHNELVLYRMPEQKQ